jgi:hypothetical protein
METIKVSVEVNIGLTDALRAILEKFSTLEFTVGSSNAAEEPKQALPAKPLTAEQQLKDMKQENPAIATLKEKLDLKPVERKPAEIVRAAMTECRTRIEGEGYTKDSPFHKELTAEFKKVAQFLGADKPSELPADKVASFCEALEHIVVDDGELSNEAPF